MTVRPTREKLCTLSGLEAALSARRAAGARVVLTNGCFDLIHPGHTRYLEEARGLGDILVVALNGDDSVRRLKGPDRPVLPASDRAEVLAALQAVDYVVVFDEDTAETVVRRLRPDIYVKGADYSAAGAPYPGKPLPEARAVQEHGGQVRLLPFHSGSSTSAIIARIRQGAG